MGGSDLPCLYVYYIYNNHPYPPLGCMQFATYEASKKFVEPLLPKAMHAYSHFVCAAGAFLSCSVVMVPGELLKQRLQVGR